MSIVSRVMGIGSVRAPQAVVKHRAPTGALTPLAYSYPGQPVYPDFSGEAAIDLAYLRNVYVYKCISSIANSISGLPFRVGDPVSNNYRLTHPLAVMLGPAHGSPNPSMSAASLWRYAITQYLLLGKFAWRVERDNRGNVVGLWPLQAQFLNPEIATSGANYFQSYHYGVLGQAGYQKFRTEDVCYIYRPSITDVRKPESAIQAASVNINVAKMLDQFDYSFLKNGGVPAHLIITPQFATAEDRTNFQTQFAAEFGGAANVGRSMFAERDFDPGEGSQQVDSVDVKTIGTTQRDAQLQIVRQAEIQAICIAFGVPLSILGDASHRTFENADAERRNYWLETLQPLTRELQDGINVQLASQVGKEVGWFDTRSVPELRPVPSIPAAQVQVFLDNDLVTEDEVRSMFGLPAGKEVGLDKVWEENKKQEEALPAVTPANSLPGDAGTPVVPPASAPARSVRHAGHDGHQPILSGHATKLVLEKVLSDQLQALLDEQALAVRNRVSGRRGRNSGDVLFDVAMWTLRANTTILPVLTALNVGSEKLIADAMKGTQRALQEAIARSEPSDWQQAVDEVFAGRLVPILQTLTGKPVPASAVEDLLLDLANGQLDIDGALIALEEV